MSHPSAKLCAECFPSALRATRGLRPTRLRGAARRSYATEQRALDTLRRPNRSTLACVSLESIRPQLAVQVPQKGRGLATVSGGEKTTTAPPQDGPMREYDARVQEGRLRDDEYQRAKVVLLRFFVWRGAKKKAKSDIPDNLPKGLYMYGDVGCGKTMLMDLFFDTLPPNIKRKTRIHFHNFMQDVHKRMHVVKMKYGNDFDALPMVAADIAELAGVLCFDEFQCTDVADAMILRRLLEILMSHGVVLVTTSNRHPDDLYKNGIQRQSFIPCINLLKTDLSVINLNSPTDYRKIPRPPAAVYHHPLGEYAQQHAQKWFEFLGDPVNDPPHTASQVVWGREIKVPCASGKAAQFTFQQLIGTATGAADYLELVRHYDAFIVTDVPSMNHTQRDLARRFITFIDAVYESRAKLVLTTEVPLTNLFISETDIKKTLKGDGGDHSDLSDAMRILMDDLGMSVQALKNTSIFSGDEERFAFARALSRLSEMGSKEWVERGSGLGNSPAQNKEEHDAWQKTRSHWSEDNM
ncbi:hypothetical protein N7463_006048 [Penicillium fimorum]|uniref:ATPase, AFG1-like n=1 Tax=Penicillium fimorum TaxID=1882269 RepID=A0A9W9XU35_9EURO|nr:hypothetical protein N7463_006048 [Penicillium fimorum]